MSWFDSKTETENQEEEKSGVWGSQLAKALSDARKGGVSSEKRGKTKSEKSDSGSNLSVKAQEKIAELFEPSKWKTIIRVPFQVGKGITGRDCWNLDKEEEATLASTTSASFEYLAVTDPKMLCIGMCLVNWAMILSAKFIVNAQERAKEELLNPKKPDEMHLVGK